MLTVSDMNTTTARVMVPGLASLVLLTLVQNLEAAASIKEREGRQQDRIAEGIASGELTPAEAARLEAREAELRKQIAADRAANGGKLTAAQRKAIEKELDEISRKIARNKHDGQRTKAEPKSQVGRREQRQQQRIAEGVQSGELTPAEAARLEARAAELRRQIAEDRGANGGRLTAEQRAQINTELDQISRRIRAQKHDAQATPQKK
jgi:hypothetical protein